MQTTYAVYGCHEERRDYIATSDWPEEADAIAQMWLDRYDLLVICEDTLTDLGDWSSTETMIRRSTPTAMPYETEQPS